MLQLLPVCFPAVSLSIQLDDVCRSKTWIRLADDNIIITKKGKIKLNFLRDGLLNMIQPMINKGISE